MSEKLTIIPDFKNATTITFHPNYLKKYNSSLLRRGYLRYGINAYEISVKTSENLNENEVLIPIEVINKLLISIRPIYEVKFYKNEIILGPTIGILAGKTLQSVENTVENLTNYVYSYNNIGGAIYVFSLEGVNKNEELIKGYVFDPLNNSWLQCEFFYPSTIFKRISIDQDWRNHFHKKLNGNIFNDYAFNKLEMFEYLKPNKNILAHLPETENYTNPKKVREFLKVYNEVYIKPKYGSQGSNILKITKRLEFYNIQYRDTKHNTNIDKILDKNELSDFLNSMGINKTYIVQKSIKFISFKDQSIDFRLMLLKDEDMKWREIGIVSRLGVEKSIISNVSSGGMAMVSNKLLKEYMNMSDYDIFKILNDMRNIAIETANTLELCGMHLANLGFDMSLDEDGHIWIIEINNKDPNHTIAIDAKDKQMFYKTKLASMLYAKRLCGFL